ncbi:MAG: GNAT family N-acetyltransferase [Candidatus Omnitrophica bacterium]|nr:GNAT family N-acetyltransferase [Candidatus Omnitrophota bacterium]
MAKYAWFTAGIVLSGFIAGTILSAPAEPPPGVLIDCMSPALSLQSSAIRQSFLFADRDPHFRRYDPVSVLVISRAELEPYRTQALSLLGELGFLDTMYGINLLSYAFKESPSSGFILLRQNNNVVGISVVCDGIDSEEAVILAMGVRPDLHNRGLGKILFKETMRYLRRHGYLSFYTELVRTGNNASLERWIGEMEKSRELTITRKGIAYDFHADIVFVRVDFEPVPGIESADGVPDAGPRSTPQEISAFPELFFQSSV